MNGEPALKCMHDEEGGGDLTVRRYKSEPPSQL